MAKERALVVPAISLFEVFKWVLREHGEAKAIQAAAGQQFLLVQHLQEPSQCDRRARVAATPAPFPWRCG